MMRRPKREPSADLRQAAAGMAELFTALSDEGFTEAQALTILGQVIASQTKPNDGGPT
jgi:hypothetical protein